ncbi:MAG: aldo/keto reductase [Pirellulaceae bacterium]|nr:aldo/keto reductase [Pirellulaceae bacterium]
MTKSNETSISIAWQGKAGAEESADAASASHSNARLPSVGLGLWKIANADAANLVQQAIRVGYRHLDSACDYGNEREVGDGIRKAFDEKLVTREQLWITSKLWNTYHHPQHVRPALEKTLRDLQVDYLDLYLIHFPITLKHVPIETRYPPGWFYDPSASSPQMLTDSVPIADTWGAMEELHRAGLVRHIGISNFGCSLIRDLLATASIRPAVLQVESHPYLTQEKLLRYCQQERIAYTAFSPLGAGSYIPLGMATDADSVLGQPVVNAIAAAHGKTAAQVVLRWGVQRGTAVIPKTSQPQRLVENLNIFDFELTSDEMQSIARLNRNQRFNDPGVFCESAFGCYYPIYE